MAGYLKVELTVDVLCELQRILSNNYRERHPDGFHEDAIVFDSAVPGPRRIVFVNPYRIRFSGEPEQVIGYQVEHVALRGPQQMFGDLYRPGHVIAVWLSSRGQATLRNWYD